MQLEVNKRKRFNKPSEYFFNEDGTRDEFVQIFASDDLWKSGVAALAPNKTYVKIIYHRTNAHSVKIQYGDTVGWVHISSFDSFKDSSTAHAEWNERRKLA